MKREADIKIIESGKKMVMTTKQINGKYQKISITNKITVNQVVQNKTDFSTKLR